VKSEQVRPILYIGMLIIAGGGLQGWSARADKSSRKRLEFRLIAMADGIDDEATNAGFRTVGDPDTHLGSSKFEASDGETLITYDGEFRSSDEAKRYLDWTLARYSKTLTRAIKTDSQGKSVGYRAEVLLPPDRKESAVVWTNGVMFFEIIARSLADARELETRK
jgi:hypothetical protein